MNILKWGKKVQTCRLFLNVTILNQHRFFIQYTWMHLEHRIFYKDCCIRPTRVCYAIVVFCFFFIYVCGFKRVGSRIGRWVLGPASCRLGSLAAAWDWSRQGLCIQGHHLKSAFHTKRMVNPHTLNNCALYIMLYIFLLNRLKISHTKELWLCIYS